MAARNHIAAIERTLKVVESFNGRRAVSLGELASRTRMIKSSVFRILYTLGELGYVEKDSQGHYSLTPRWENLCLGAQPTRELIRISAPLMANLLNRYKETVNLGVLDGGDVLYIHVIESPHAFRLAAHAGMRSPLYSTALGKCLLSNLSSEEVDGILKEHPIRELTPHTIRSKVAFKRALERVRTQGYAIDDGEDSPGARCVAAPVFNATGEVLAAISISGPAGRIIPKHDPEMADSLMDTCRRISITLKYAALPTSSVAAGGR